MPKSISIVPQDVRKPGQVTFDPIPVNQYQKTLSEERGRYSDSDLRRIHRDMAVIRVFESLLQEVKTQRQFNGLANLRQLWADPYFWNALGNMVFYVATVVVQYAIAFGLALLLNADIKAQKFFRVSFLLPFMLSPVAVSWMIGKSMLE